MEELRRKKISRKGNDSSGLYSQLLILFTNCLSNAYLFVPLPFKSEVLVLFLAFGLEVLFDSGLCATTPIVAVG
jgi:hypothetical protein